MKNNLTKYYRWQFLRLNKSYRETYDWHLEHLKSLQDGSQKQSFIDSLKKELFEDYGINGVYDYKQRIPPPELIIEGEDPPAQKGTIANVFEGRCNKNQTINNHYLIETIVTKYKRRGKERIGWHTDIYNAFPKYVNVVVNCDFVLEDILNDVTKIYAITRHARKNCLNIIKVRKLSKENIKELNSCIKVYKMRAHGKINKWIYIGKKLYPNISLESSADRVRKHFKKAVSLVNGGYRKIVV